MRLLDIDRSVVREATIKLLAGNANRGNGKGKSKPIGKKRSPATVNRYKAALSSVFEYGRDRYYLPNNPCRQVKALTEDNARIRFLTDHERESLLTACRDSDWAGLYLLVLMPLPRELGKGSF